MSAVADATDETRRVAAALYEAGTTGDFETFARLISDDIVVHEPPYLAYGGVYRGSDDVLALAAKVAEVFDMDTLRRVSVVVDGEHAISEIRMADQLEGVERRLLERMTVRDGKVVEMLITFFNPPPAGR